ncbi:MAG: [Fe-Fe] hydrogenase large subunit C-terminal domain-containing protein, partial [Treponemataceae bacterium]
NPLVDYVLSAEELGALFVAMDIDVSEMPDNPVLRPAKVGGRSFPWSGGVASAVARFVPQGIDLRADSIDGLNKEGMKKLKAYAACTDATKLEGNLLEVMACQGGCVSGPSVIANAKIASMQLRKIAEGSEE